MKGLVVPEQTEDYTADPVLAWEGGSVTQLELRRAVCSWLAAPLLEARGSLQLALAEAERVGLEPLTFTPEQLERRFEIWCIDRGIDPENGPIFMAQAFKLPELAARDFYDTAGQFQIVSAMSAARNEELRADYTAGLPEGMAAAMGASIDQVLASMQAANGASEDPDLAFREGLTALGQISLVRTGATREQLGKRFWTHFDHALPDDAVLGVALDPVEGGAPPWTSDRVDYVSLSDLWPLFEGGLTELQLERVLREYLFFDVLFDATRAEGHLASDASDWAQWSDEFDAMMQTALGAKASQVELLGYPSLDTVRMARRIEHAFEAAMGPDWRTSDDLRAFFRRNRMFVDGWTITGYAAFFPAVSPSRMAEVIRERSAGDPNAQVRIEPDEARELLSPDWEQAEQGALALLERHAAGEDFAALSKAHTSELTRAYQEARGQGAADGFASVFGNGQFSASLNQVAQNVKLGPFQRMVRCGGPFHPSLAFEEPGTPVGPLRTPLGYFVYRLDRVGLPALEREYEDAKFQTEFVHRDFALMAWANEILRASGLPLTER